MDHIMKDIELMFREKNEKVKEGVEIIKTLETQPITMNRCNVSITINNYASNNLKN